MVETGTNERTMTLPALLAQRAREASDGRLVLDATGGLLVGALATAARPPAWPVISSAAAVFVAFGAWGILDRIVTDGSTGPHVASALRVLRAGAAGLGAVSALALVFTAMAMMLGTWIS